jgi:hypothetical protein
MSLTVNAKTYTPDAYQQNAVGYIGSLKTVSVKDDIILKRVQPKPTAVFSGVGRTEAKLTRTLVLTGALSPSGDGIVDINISVPVGFASADVDALLNDMGAYLASAPFKLLVKTQQLVF